MARWDDVEEALDGTRPSGSDWRRCNCPFCPDAVGVYDRRQSLSVNESVGIAKCFRCETVARAPWYDRDAARTRGEHTAPRVQLPAGAVPVWSAHAPAWARTYLARRGLDPAVAVDASLFAVDFRGRRVVVPVSAPSGELVGWVARLVEGYGNKYEAAAGPWASATVYNQVALTEQTDRPVYVVEGVFDALALWPDAVALFGKVLKGTQLHILRTARRPVVVCLDGDARTASWAVTMQLRLAGVPAECLPLPAKRDPGDLPRGWVADRAKLLHRASAPTTTEGP